MTNDFFNDIFNMFGTRHNIGEVIKEKNNVYVTIDTRLLGNYRKEDIKLHIIDTLPESQIEESRLVLVLNGLSGETIKHVSLRCYVNRKDIKYTFVNGILDIKLKRRKR